jgi:hypothetical protein
MFGNTCGCWILSVSITSQFKCVFGHETDLLNVWAALTVLRPKTSMSIITLKLGSVIVTSGTVSGSRFFCRMLYDILQIWLVVSMVC